jgi:hypothetical protein
VEVEEQRGKKESKGEFGLKQKRSAVATLGRETQGEGLVSFKKKTTELIESFPYNRTPSISQEMPIEEAQEDEEN